MKGDILSCYDENHKVKDFTISRGENKRACGPYLKARAPRSTGLVLVVGARQATRNVRGKNIEIEKDTDIPTTGPEGSGEGP